MKLKKEIYANKDVVELINQYYPLILRILKNNENFFQIFGSKIKWNKKFKTSLKDVLIRNFFNVYRHIELNSKQYWSIHKNCHYGSGDSWINEYNFAQIKYEEEMVIIACGMVFNRMGISFFDRGCFFNDYMKLKNILTQK